MCDECAAIGQGVTISFGGNADGGEHALTGLDIPSFLLRV